MEQVQEYVYNNYKHLKDKTLLIVEHDSFYTIRVNEDESPLILSLNVVQMEILHKPSSQVITQGENMYTIKYVMGRHICVDDKNVIDRIKLGHLVKWYGGGHVVQKDDKLIICSKIEDAQYEII